MYPLFIDWLDLLTTFCMPEFFVAYTHASRVMAEVISSELLSAIVTTSSLPSKFKALPEYRAGLATHEGAFCTAPFVPPVELVAVDPEVSFSLKYDTRFVAVLAGG